MAPENLSNGNLGHFRVSEMAVNHLRAGAECEAETRDEGLRDGSSDMYTPILQHFIIHSV